MPKDLTTSRLDRQNILNNEIAVEEIQEKSVDKKFVMAKDGKSKIHKPNIIIKNKNHDKKVNIHKLQKFK